MLTPNAARRLSERLRAVGYDYDSVERRLGGTALDALGRNNSLAADRALAGADDPQATVIRTFALQQAVRTAQLRDALGDLDELDPLVTRAGDEVRAAIELRPYAFVDDAAALDGWLACDLTPTLDGRLAPVHDDFVLGVSPASVTLAQLTMRQRRGTALDLGSGCGIQSLHLATHTDRVIATDLNPRACAMTALSALLSGVTVDTRQGSLYEPVADERFDLIVTNPPYVMSPPGGRLVYREGTFTADGLVRAVLTDGAARLNPGGALQVLGNWAITADQPWAERLREWIAPTGCDALVLQREHLDPYEYIEIWLADAGLVGTDEYRHRYAEWVDYFDALGIVGVGMGWLTLYRNDRDDPLMRFEDWPHQVESGLGAAFAEFPGAAQAASAPDAELLATHWRCDPAVVSEALGRPGAEDPEHIVLRRRSGFGRAVSVDTAVAAVVGACDGDLSLQVLIGAVADLLQVDPEALAADVLPRLRPLIADGFLSAALGTS